MPGRTAFSQLPIPTRRLWESSDSAHQQSQLCVHGLLQKLFSHPLCCRMTWLPVPNSNSNRNSNTWWVDLQRALCCTCGRAARSTVTSLPPLSQPSRAVEVQCGGVTSREETRGEVYARAWISLPKCQLFLLLFIFSSTDHLHRQLAVHIGPWPVWSREPNCRSGRCSRD